MCPFSRILHYTKKVALLRGKWRISTTVRRANEVINSAVFRVVMQKQGDRTEELS